MNKNIVLLLILIIVVAAGYLFFNQASAPTVEENKTVKIGVILPLSGDAASYGQEAQKVIKYRIAEINGQGGTQFELVYEDGKCSGNDAVSAFQKLKDIDGVKFVLGGLCSSETLAIAPLTTEGEVLVVSPFSSNPDIEGASPFTFTFSYSDLAIASTLAEKMSQYSRVAIISEQNEFNVGIKNVWEEKIATYPNVTVVANEVFPKAASDFRNLIAKIRKENPEAILLNPNPGVTAENLIKQLAEVEDWKGYKLYSQIAYLNDESRAQVGATAEGMIIVDSPDLVNPDFLAYKAKIEEKEGSIATLGNFYTATNIDALDILTTLIRELGDDPKGVKEALSTRTFDGYLKGIRFNGKNFSEHANKAGTYVIENGSAVYQD